MEKFKNCKSLNDIAMQEFGKANYTNREKAKKLLDSFGIDWEEWLLGIKNDKKKFCIVCGKELKSSQSKFCGHSCSASYNNKKRVPLNVNKNLNATRKQIQNKENRAKEIYCLYCGKKLINQQKLFCNNKCQLDYRYAEYIKKWKNGENSGLKGQYSLSRHIRRFLLEKTGCKCEKCGWGETNPHTNTIPLEIHHIDGDYTNNREENLQILCPNCHSLTETYKSHNKNGRKGRSKYYRDKAVVVDTLEKGRLDEGSNPSESTIPTDTKCRKEIVTKA